MSISDSKEFFRWDYTNTLFPLRMNSLLVDKSPDRLHDFITTKVLADGGSFQSQHRVFASKKAWSLRRTVKLDPVAEFFLYDIVYRNRKVFRSGSSSREVHGYRIVKGIPLSPLGSYADFKKSVAQKRSTYKYYAYIDIASYFNHIYHHDLVRWFEDAGAGQNDLLIFGKFLREIVGGRSIDCLPQGLYPAKMIGSNFLHFLEDSNRIRAKQSVRLMDDIWLFDNDRSTLISDCLLIQSLLSDRGLSVNDRKSVILEGYGLNEDVDIDEIKVELLRKRRDRLKEEGYGEWENEEEEEDPEDLEELEQEEQDYLISLLKKDTIHEEDAELVLALMQEHSSDIMEFLPTLIKGFPGLAKKLFHFCKDVPDKEDITEILIELLNHDDPVTEYQLFWFGAMTEDYLLGTRKVGELIMALYDHDKATAITKAKILEIPEKRFGLSDMREEQLKTGHSGWLSWSSAVGARAHAKGQRNQLLKYFRKASPMNQLIGEFVESCF